ncbi:hypothetical protein [Lentzea kentuckyensis]|uniref:hypothetical protein n=1 Tax=Lentzea kentuckyensis TaxID=360086 RepID=UPI001B80534C|nr:hypothetical protein [Lentzea kentuckyensis]
MRIGAPRRRAERVALLEASATLLKQAAVDLPGLVVDHDLTVEHRGTSSQCRGEHAVNARYVRNTRLIDALMRQAMAALAGARAYYDRQRARGLPHNAALRHVGNRLVGILHGCLATSSLYDEATAWGHHTAAAAA